MHYMLVTYQSIPLLQHTDTETLKDTDLSERQADPSLSLYQTHSFYFIIGAGGDIVRPTVPSFLREDKERAPREPNVLLTGCGRGTNQRRMLVRRVLVWVEGGDSIGGSALGVGEGHSDPGR